MKITKYEHACLVLEDRGKKLVIDPGVWSASFEPTTDTVGVIITHSHGDHLDRDKIQSILAKNPSAIIYGTEEVANELKEIKVSVVTGGHEVELAPFKLQFFGGKHALVYSDLPKLGNVGVMVNEKFYYPGDSFNQPNKPVEVLAVPTSAPWLKTQEYMDFVEDIKPGRCFPTHNALLSEVGSATTNTWLQQICDKTDTKLVILNTSQSIEI